MTSSYRDAANSPVGPGRPGGPADPGLPDGPGYPRGPIGPAGPGNPWAPVGPGPPLKPGAPGLPTSPFRPGKPEMDSGHWIYFWKQRIYLHVLSFLNSWNVAGSWHPFLWMARAHLSCISSHGINIDRWLRARLQYLHCWRTGDTTVLH